jgi:excinuclease ABC subunit B
MPERFELVCPFQPTGDQPQAIEKLSRGIQGGAKHQTLLGITGSGKTFTMAATIARVNRPTLVLSPNKTLAAQLYSRVQGALPEQRGRVLRQLLRLLPARGLRPSTDTYIEKDASRNESIERLRNSATRSLLERRDVLIVASVSCIYGLGSPDNYARWRSQLARARRSSARSSCAPDAHAVRAQQHRLPARHVPRARRRDRGVPGVRGGGRDPRRALRRRDRVAALVNPLRARCCASATHHDLSRRTTTSRRGALQRPIERIEAELDERLDELRGETLLEAQRLEQRTRHDLEMLRATGVCNGIENYSRCMDGRAAGEPPFTLLNYFPRTGSCSSTRATSRCRRSAACSAATARARRRSSSTASACRARSTTAAALRGVGEARAASRSTSRPRRRARARALAGRVAEQIVRPTGLLDPAIEVRPARTQVDDLLHEIRKTVAAAGACS